MNYDLILNNIARHIQLDKKEVECFTSILQHKTIKKKDFLIRTGEICRYENFVIKGCLRTYYIDSNGFERILQFAIEDWWTADLNSFLTQTPATLNIDALENSEVLQIEKNNMEELYKKVPKFERFFRIIFQNGYVAQQYCTMQKLAFTAEERYPQFKKKYPQFEQSASLKNILPLFLA